MQLHARMQLHALMQLLSFIGSYCDGRRGSRLERQGDGMGWNRPRGSDHDEVDWGSDLRPEAGVWEGGGGLDGAKCQGGQKRKQQQLQRRRRLPISIYHKLFGC